MKPQVVRNRPMKRLDVLAGEARLAAKYTAVSLTGFVIDAALLQLGIHLGLQPAIARLISLVFAMQATFVINGLYVFRCLALSRLVGQWAGYMASNGVGNFCNYWIFVTLVSLHWPIVSAPLFALSVGAACAWAINYATTRWLVFGEGGAARKLLQRAGIPRPVRYAPPPAAPE